MTRSALIRDASRHSLDEGTEWRDRLGKWLKVEEPPIPVIYRWHRTSGYEHFIGPDFDQYWNQIMNGLYSTK